MKFLSFVIMMVILEVLFLFYFKQTSSMVAMSVINIGALCCFFSKNWRHTQKTYKTLVVSAFIIGNIFTLIRELIEGNESSEIVYFAIIISALINFFFTSAIAFPHLSGAPNNSFNSSTNLSSFTPQHLGDDSNHTYYTSFDEDYMNSNDDNSFRNRIEINTEMASWDDHHDMFSGDINPATGLPMCGDVDSSGYIYGTRSHEFSSYSSSFDDSYSSSSSFDNDFSTPSGFDHDDYSRRDS
ncbi:hypothetical protein [Arsenophonus nasoniae]|uniref:Uncharacterized protein n=1 Tax=Arsenophonus nasoniae TaxID=638 RepID=A0ABY8NWW4_9GAMM|nr:hypothetical protein [Arsenophonus nasoniae]WGM08873.1 hypothetical protein QE258_26300 [Arsenophonus nasoniae]